MFLIFKRNLVKFDFFHFCRKLYKFLFPWILTSLFSKIVPVSERGVIFFCSPWLCPYIYLIIFLFSASCIIRSSQSLQFIFYPNNLKFMILIYFFLQILGKAIPKNLMKLISFIISGAARISVRGSTLGGRPSRGSKGAEAPRTQENFQKISYENCKNALF